MYLSKIQLSYGSPITLNIAHHPSCGLGPFNLWYMVGTVVIVDESYDIRWRPHASRVNASSPLCGI